MFSVQKKDFTGIWVEIYGSQMFVDANRFKDTVSSGTGHVKTRIV